MSLVYAIAPQSALASGVGGPFLREYLLRVIVPMKERCQAGSTMNRLMRALLNESKTSEDMERYHRHFLLVEVS